VFSQWYPCNFHENVGDDDIVQQYNCTEQYMMTKKAETFGDHAMKEKILASDDPKKIKAYGRKVKNFDPETWSKISYDIVVQGNRLKFGQNKDLQSILLSTEPTTLVEASPYDNLWGIGMTAAQARNTSPEQWNGKNLLGKALTQVRNELVPSL